MSNLKSSSGFEFFFFRKMTICHLASSTWFGQLYWLIICFSFSFSFIIIIIFKSLIYQSYNNVRLNTTKGSIPVQLPKVRRLLPLQSGARLAVNLLLTLLSDKFAQKSFGKSIFGNTVEFSRMKDIPDDMGLKP